MKSAYELAMERLGKADPAAAPLSPEQKARLAEIDRIYQGKLAEREIFLKQQLDHRPEFLWRHVYKRFVVPFGNPMQVDHPGARQSQAEMWERVVTVQPQVAHVYTAAHGHAVEHGDAGDGQEVHRATVRRDRVVLLQRSLL